MRQESPKDPAPQKNRFRLRRKYGLDFDSFYAFKCLRKHKILCDAKNSLLHLKVDAASANIRKGNGSKIRSLVAGSGCGERSVLICLIAQSAALHPVIS
ncbi:hypothetical protein VWY06_13290 [Phaeobacter sp. JH20_10]|uniref:hypothetical protein n=1 Tax=unclassified Phaeobacter TaxID=2621772 RepID=UPI003A86B952